MIPKGKLLIIGGHEDKGKEIAGENLTVHKKKETISHFEILGLLISKIPRAHHIIEIIASASSIQKEMEDLYIESFKREGFTHVGIIKVENEKDAADPDSIKRVKGAHAVFFTGGDQSKLVSLLTQTKLLSTIRNKYYSDKNFIVGGTSAGAMAIPETIITGGLIREALYKEDIKIAKGFDLIKDVIVDTHFIKRGRFARLAHAVALNPSCLGIGLGENTALIISEGNVAECLGSGMVILIDGREIGITNVDCVVDCTPIVIENLKTSIIAEGSCYLLKERRFLVK
ncbi:MAG: cyanophycinase [Bacteroidota bacterium]|nr:cyanophycinase [Bacteroidota bacterium]